jgi:hypothetical protein
MIAIVTLAGIIVSIPYGVTLHLFLDPWTYLWFIVWLGTTFFVRQAVRGLVCLFGVPEENEYKAFYPPKKITGHKCVGDFDAYSIVVKQFQSSKTPDSVPRLLRALFDKDKSFEDFRDEVSDALFSVREIPLGIAAFCFFFFMWWGPTSIPWDLYGEIGLLVDVHWWFTTAFWFFECLLFASFFNIYYAMLKGTHLIGKGPKAPKGLLINDYLHYLDGDIEDLVISKRDKSIQDFDAFSQLTKPIGEVFSNVTLGFIAVLIIIDVYWTIYNVINNVPLEPIALLYPFFGMGIAALMFIVPQYSVHRTLESYKTLISERLIRSRMITNTRLIQGTSSLPANMKDKDELNKKLKELEPFIRLHKTGLDTLDSMIEKLNNTSTWTLNFSMLSKLSFPVMFEAILKITEFVLRG